MHWFKIKEMGYEYSIYSQNFMINNVQYRKYAIRILYTYLQPKKHKIFIIKRYEVKDEYYIFTYLN